MTGDEPADVLEYNPASNRVPPSRDDGRSVLRRVAVRELPQARHHIAQTALGIPTPLECHVPPRNGSEAPARLLVPTARRDERNPARHTSKYDALLERISAATGLDFIDAAFLRAATADRVARQQLFIGALMLDLMQRVVLDLDLDGDRDYPHNAGWLTIFRQVDAAGLGVLGERGMRRATAMVAASSGSSTVSQPRDSVALSPRRRVAQGFSPAPPARAALKGCATTDKATECRD